MSDYNYTLKIAITAQNSMTPMDDIHLVEFKASLERAIRALDQAEHATAKARVTLTEV